MAAEGRPKAPPADLAQRRLPLVTWPRRRRFARVHWLAHDPRFFGPATDPSSGRRLPPANRFDDPRGEYGVLYAAADAEAAVVETVLGDLDLPFVARRDVEARGLAVFEVRRPLRLVKLHGDGLRPLKLDGSVSTAAHERPRLWSRAFHEHPAAPDGILYRSRVDNDLLCLALFERAGDGIVEAERRPLIELAELPDILNRHGVAWLED
jgi:hypothetical protein